MKLYEIEDKSQIIAIMAGRFHPPHKGHIMAFKWLQKKFGKAYVATSNKIEGDRSPLSFDEKEFLFGFAGIPDNSVHMTIEPYRPQEITQHVNAKNTILVYGVSEKDMKEDPRFTFQPKKDGSPSYIQPYQKEQLQPLNRHGYVITIPTFKFNLLGKPFESSTQIRKLFPTIDRNTQKQMIIDLYGKYSPNVHKLFHKKFT